VHAGLRAEEFVYQKLDKPKPPRLTESEALGQSMIEAGNDFGPGTNYGEINRLSFDRKCGAAEYFMSPFPSPHERKNVNYS